MPLADDLLIVDIGCGFGDTSHALATSGRGRRVIGIDCSEPLLKLARERYPEGPGLQFVLADAGAFDPEVPVGLCFSRFGLMFFERPVQTLRKVRSWMRPGAELVTFVWQARQRNPWLDLARDAVLEHLPPIETDAPSCGPGPFSMAREETTRGILEAAGFVNIRFRSLYANVWVGEDSEHAADFQLTLGPGGELMRHGAENGHSGVAAARDAAVAALRPYETSRGVYLPSASWWIQASVK
jgi:ubiquinone/menaquinone biosynthesis C-methylase UbiE